MMRAQRAHVTLVPDSIKICGFRLHLVRKKMAVSGDAAKVLREDAQEESTHPVWNAVAAIWFQLTGYRYLDWLWRASCILIPHDPRAKLWRCVWRGSGCTQLPLQA